MVDLRGALVGLLALAIAGCSGGESAAPVAPAAGPAASIRAALAEPDVYRRSEALAARLAELGPDAVPAVRDALDEAALDDGDAIAPLLLFAFWSDHEPEAAARWAAALAPPVLREAAVARGVERWARDDPQRVVRELGITPARSARPAMLAALIRGWDASGQPGLGEYVRDLGAGFQQQRALAAWARAHIAREGTAATMVWAEQWGEGLRDKSLLALYRQVGSELAIADPAAGVAWCDAHCEGPHGDAVRQLVATRWAGRDVDGALGWLAASTDADALQRERALRAAFRVCVRRDRDGALHWLDAQIARDPAARWLQPAVAMASASLAAEDPHAALRWAERLRDETERENALGFVFRTWRTSDPAAADAWLESAPLSAETRARILAAPAGSAG